MAHETLSETALSQLFTGARTHHRWTDRDIEPTTLQQLYELFKWGPTSVNANPARVIFLRDDSAKARLYPALMDANVEQVRAAPVTAIVCYDEAFPNTLSRLFPAFDAKPLFDSSAQLTYETAFRNSSLQGAYMILAARALGLDVCPMSGFDNAKVDAEFLEGTTWRSNFLCLIGYGDSAGLYPRGPRLTFDEACMVL
jgi:3-hydroxypropanoate dehydrogenase